MKEIWQLATSPGILPATILLGVVLVYWIIGALGVINLDLDGADPSACHHTGDGGSAGHDGHDGVFANVMGGMSRLVNARDIPLMVVLSLVALFFWGSLMIAHHLLSWIHSGLLALISIAAALLLTRFSSSPIRPFFIALKKDSETHVPVIGRTGVVRSIELTEFHGQIEVPDPIGPMLLNARLQPGSAPLKRGDEVIVFDHDAGRGIYFVKALS